jgi:oligopeptide transport system permease protein
MGSLGRYVVRRLLMMPPLLLLISLAAFALVRVIPGGPFDRERKPASPEIERQLRARYHLDEPLLKQYGRYLAGLARGDLGPSLKYRNHTVNDLVAQGLPTSLALGAMAFLLALGLGIPLGLISAAGRGTWADPVANLLALVAICIPAFVIGPLLVMVFALHWRWFPPALWESWWHAILPIVTLGVFFAGRIARLTREGMVRALNAGFLMTARAKGLSEVRVILAHALPLGILPVVSYSGPLLADLLTGSFVVENLFQIPGIGVFLVNAALNRDYSTVVGLVILYAVLLLILNLMVDLAYALLDPRVTYE